MPFWDWTTLKPLGMLFSSTSHEEPSGCESTAWPVLRHRGQLRNSTQWSLTIIPQICADGGVVQADLQEYLVGKCRRADITGAAISNAAILFHRSTFRFRKLQLCVVLASESAHVEGRNH